MQIGLQFPTREIAPTRSAIAQWVDAAAESGADYFMVSDHVLGVDPEKQESGWDKAWMHPSTHRTRYTHQDPWHEPFTLMAFMAARCELGLMTGVLVLPQRNTALVAKQAAQVDILSNGKLRLGVGVGWNAAEFASMGMSFADRGRRFSEQLVVLRRFWNEEVVSFEGDFHAVRAAGIAPRPVQQPIPLWIGGASLTKGVAPVAKLLDRIGRMGDGWCLDSATPPDDTTAEAMRHIRDAAAKAGRDGNAIGVDARLCVLPLKREGLVARAEGWGRLGATHLTIDPYGIGVTGQPDTAKALRELVTLTRDAYRCGAGS
jgi:probable F420-dependent oxidoreductase